jgi:tRNA(Ile)-lysidine synthase
MSNRRNILFEPPAAGDWLLLKDKNLAVAFSGGKDSLALLHYLKGHEHTLNSRIHAIHINHGLRGEESERDETFCRRYCEENRIIFKARSINVRQDALVKQRGMEYAARKLRYEALREEQESSGYDYVLTAHTLDDRIETFFTDLITGASIFTLGGIEFNNAGVIRPFLSVTSAMIEEFLAEHKLTPVYDSSNSNLNLVRNKVRAQMPFLLTMKDAVLRLQEESARVSSWLSERTKTAVTSHGEDFVEINRGELKRMSEAERGYLIGRWVSRLCRGGKAHSDMILNSLEQRDSIRFSLPMGFISEVSAETVRIFPAAWVKEFRYIKPAGALALAVPDRNLTVEFTESLKDKQLIVRNRRDGDRFRGKKLKKLFSDAKLPLILRDRAVIVTEENNEVIWVEHLAVKDGENIKLKEAVK